MVARKKQKVAFMNDCQSDDPQARNWPTEIQSVSETSATREKVLWLVR